MPGQIKIDDGSGNYTILTNGGSLSSDKTITIPNTTGTMALTSDITSGLSSAQQFRLTANITSSGTNDITSNLEVPDTENQGNMGSLVSESSGIFTFSETGYYAVIVQASAFAKQTRVLTLATDDNSTYTQVAWAGVITDTEGVAGGFSMVILDVTNTTNDKVKFQSYMQTSGGTVYGSSTSSNTSFTFPKLGAT